jgi:hypothetical protein
MREPVPGFIGVDTAAAVLGVSRLKFRKLAAEAGLEVRATPMDKRVKLVALEDLEKLRSRQSTVPTVLDNGAGR